MKIFPSHFIAAIAICLVSFLPAAYASDRNEDWGGGHHSVAISPVSSTLQVGQTQQFTATVSGTNDQTVHWLVNGYRGGNPEIGTINASGLYTAPAKKPSQAVNVTARSVVFYTATASAAVFITSGTSMSVSISPTNASLHTGQTQQFSATISGATASATAATTNTSVQWLVNGVLGGNSAAGTISSAGLYTAPVTVPAGLVTVTAQSSNQSSASASASVSVLPPVAVTVSISPTNASLQTGQTQQFGATVSGTSNTAINWLVDGVPGGNATAGTI